jgi:hypothetical protein
MAKNNGEDVGCKRPRRAGIGQLQGCETGDRRPLQTNPPPPEQRVQASPLTIRFPTTCAVTYLSAGFPNNFAP